MSPPDLAECVFSAVVRLARAEDIPALATVTAHSLPNDFIVRLGRTFLTRVLFPTLLESPRSRICVAEENGEVMGLIITRVGSSGVLGETLTRRPFWSVAACTCATIRRPVLLRDCPSVVVQLFFRNVRPNATAAELFLMAVDGRARRRGIGTRLVRHSAARLRAGGITTYRVLFHSDNDAADRFYESNGFAERKEYRFAGRTWCEREMKLTPSI